MVVNNRLGYLFVFLGMSMALYAQRKTEVIRYGDLDQWVVRKITESAIIGKETKTLYCVGPTDTIRTASFEALFFCFLSFQYPIPFGDASVQ